MSLRWAILLAALLALAGPALAAVDFDSNDDFRTTTQGVVTAPPFTISLWVYPTGLDATNRAVLTVSDNAAPGTRFWTWQANTTSLKWFAGDGGGNSSANTSIAPTANAWQHWCAVEASTSSRACYINGGSKGTNGTTRTPTAGTWSSFVGAATVNFAGRLAHLAVWNVALSDDEILGLANGQHPFAVRPAALIHYYPMWRLEGGGDDFFGTVDLGTVTGDPVTVEGPAVLRPVGPYYGWAAPERELWWRREDALALIG